MRELQPVRTQFDAIVVSGLSGVIPGAIVALRLKKQLVVIRKDDDKTHGAAVEGVGYLMEDFKPNQPYIVLDDFIAMGSTMRRMYNRMKDMGHGMPVYTMLYDGYKHYPVYMKTRNNDFTDPLDQWYVHGKPATPESKYLFIPYAASDHAGQHPNPDLWRPANEALPCGRNAA